MHGAGTQMCVGVTPEPAPSSTLGAASSHLEAVGKKNKTGSKCFLRHLCSKSLSALGSNTRRHIVLGRSPPAGHTRGWLKVAGQVGTPECSRCPVPPWQQRWARGEREQGASGPGFSHPDGSVAPGRPVDSRKAERGVHEEEPSGAWRRKTERGWAAGGQLSGKGGWHAVTEVPQSNEENIRGNVP